MDRTFRDGSRWHPTSDARRAANHVPVTLRRYWPKLCDDVYHDRVTNMKNYEHLTINSLKVIAQTGEVMLAGPHFFSIIWDCRILRWLAFCKFILVWGSVIAGAVQSLTLARLQSNVGIAYSVRCAGKS